MTFTKNGIKNIDKQRSENQAKLDSRLPNNADVLRTQPFEHPKKVKTTQFKSSGLEVDF